MSKNIKDKDVKDNWSLSIGFYPGILFGGRTYEEKNQVTHVLYLPFIDIALEIFANLLFWLIMSLINVIL